MESDFLFYSLLLGHKSYKEDLLSLIIKTLALVLAIVFPNYTAKMVSYQGSLVMNNVLCAASQRTSEIASDSGRQ